MTDPLLDKADALMHRRSFVAGSKTATAEESSEISDEVDAEDFPLLTEVVDERRHLTPQPNDATAWPADTAVREQLKQLLIERHMLLANEIEIWLDEQMPQLVIRAMDGITDHLVALLANRARDELLPRLEAAMQPPAEENQDSDSSE